MIGFNIKLDGANKLITQNTLNLTWEAKAEKQEKDIQWETQQSHVDYVENGDYDFEQIAKENLIIKNLISQLIGLH